METVTIDILCESPDLMPVRATPGAAAFDLRAAHEAEVWQGDTVLIKTGVRLALPPGYVGKVCSRSGLALKEGVFVVNAPGIIDEDYRGEIGVILGRLRPGVFRVNRGDRIAQLLIERVEPVAFRCVDRIDCTQRGEAGFGSTGNR